MNAAAGMPFAGKSLLRPWAFVALLALVAALAVTGRSFWIDETYTARLAQQPTPAAGWQLLREIKGSDPQMPLYVGWIWACEKVIGSSEWALRAVNLLWFFPALMVLRRALAPNRTLQLAVLGAALFSPFAWYYLNEARAYTLQFSTSLMLFACLWRWARMAGLPPAGERVWVGICCAALIGLCGSSLLSMALVLTPAMVAFVLLPAKHWQSLLKHFWRIWAGTLTVLFLLGMYYLWTLHSGDRATAIAGLGWKNAVFIAYELLGFAGLGPGRLALRAGGGLALFKPYAPALLAYAVTVAALLGLALRDLQVKLGGKRLVALAVALVVPAGLLLAASAHLHFRILGRHFAALWPVAILLLGYGLAAGWRRGGVGKLLAAGFIVLYLASALSLRFAVRHAKDDYRAAADLAKAGAAHGQSVWWNADQSGAIYYQVPLVTGGVASAGQVLWLVNPSSATLAAAGLPDLIIVSRPDVYDTLGVLPEFLRRENYQLATHLTAFQIWQHSLKN